MSFLTSDYKKYVHTYNTHINISCFLVNFATSYFNKSRIWISFLESQLEFIITEWCYLTVTEINFFLNATLMTYKLNTLSSRQGSIFLHCKLLKFYYHNLFTLYNEYLESGDATMIENERKSIWLEEYFFWFHS